MTLWTEQTISLCLNTEMAHTMRYSTSIRVSDWFLFSLFFLFSFYFSEDRILLSFHLDKFPAFGKFQKVSIFRSPLQDRCLWPYTTFHYSDWDVEISRGLICELYRVLSFVHKSLLLNVCIFSTVFHNSYAKLLYKWITGKQNSKCYFITMSALLIDDCQLHPLHNVLHFKSIPLDLMSFSLMFQVLKVVQQLKCNCSLLCSRPESWGPLWGLSWMCH